MKKVNSNKHRRIWSSVLVLFVCVALTTMIVVGRFNGFLLDASGAISLIPDDTEEQNQVKNNTIATQQNEVASSVTAAPDTQPEKSPGFAASDEETVWETNTQVEIFKVSYENGEQVVTVNSGDGDKVIAPGTENSYTFKLENTGNVALDYTVTVDAYFTPEDIKIPITGRINRYDGKWIVGNEDSYVEVTSLDVAEDSDTLGAGRYTYYTLDWMWPYESGDDEHDTWLGNLATEQDLSFTIVISTIAEASYDSDSNKGIVPQTGDDSHVNMWIILAGVSLVMIIGSLFYKKNEDDYSDTEAAKN